MDAFKTSAGKPLTLPNPPRRRRARRRGDTGREGRQVGRIGVEVGYEQSMVRAAGLLDAARLSYHHNVESAGLVFKTLRGLFLGEASPKQLTGFIGIAQASGTMAAEGAAAAVRVHGDAVDEPRPSSTCCRSRCSTAATSSS